MVASGSYDKTVRLWDAVTGAPLQTLEGHSSHVSSVAFSPDGKVVASGSDDKTVRLWDAVMGAPLQTLEGHLSYILSVAFSPDSKVVVSGSDDKTIRLWDAVTGAPLQTLEGYLNCVSSVAFLPDGKVVVSGWGDKMVWLWDTITGAPLQTLKLGIKTTNLSFSTLGQHLRTNRGVLDISSFKLSPDSLEQLRALFVLNDWITEKGKNILWLPPDYRATCVAVWNGTIVLGLAWWGILFLQFELGSKMV